jgi:predicted transcriptional regulator
MPTTPSTTPVSLKLDPAIKAKINRLAVSRNRTAHWLMREAIAQFVEREEKREAFRQETLAAFQEFQETGLHITGDEAFAWLDSWGSDNELAAPECHD